MEVAQKKIGGDILGVMMKNSRNLIMFFFNRHLHERKIFLFTK